MTLNLLADAVVTDFKEKLCARLLYITGHCQFRLTYLYLVSIKNTTAVESVVKNRRLQKKIAMHCKHTRGRRSSGDITGIGLLNG